MAIPVSVRVPATSANLGPGFDCLGVALDLWATVTLDSSGRLSDNDPMAAMALTAARRVFFECGDEPPTGLNARHEGDIPIARGLGASAVARVGGALAANKIAGGRLSTKALLALVTELEGHADNVTPALFGGLQVSVVDRDGVFHVGVPLPNELQAVLFVPELRMPTKESRKLLPDHISRGDAVYNTGRAALMVTALAAGRFDLLDAGTQDRLHQKRRSKLFPAMFALFEAAKTAGAHCAFLSGGGSTICALATANEQGIADAMLEAARVRETPGRTIITRPTVKGAEVIGTK
ncbi:MAG: homoserine kinase [Chloroflexi bacterium]|nr:MAG: homoserine kinase [Chloroflexota bacterium]